MKSKLTLQERIVMFFCGLCGIFGAVVIFLYIVPFFWNHSSSAAFEFSVSLVLFNLVLLYYSCEFITKSFRRNK